MLQSIAYGNNRFVAVGGNLSIIISTDGTSWAELNAGTGSQDFSVVSFDEYNLINNKILKPSGFSVFPFSLGSRLISTDGQEWSWDTYDHGYRIFGSAHPGVEPRLLFRIRQYERGYLGVGSVNGVSGVFGSADLTRWQQISLRGNTDFRASTCDGSRVALAGRRKRGALARWVSPASGAHVTEVFSAEDSGTLRHFGTLPDIDVSSVAVSADYLVLVGSNCILCTELKNTKKWRLLRFKAPRLKPVVTGKRDIRMSLCSPSDLLRFRDIAYGDGKFAVVGGTRAGKMFGFGVTLVTGDLVTWKITYAIAENLITGGGYKSRLPSGMPLWAGTAMDTALEYSVVR